MEDKLVTLGTYSSISDAYIYKNILDMEGIESFVVDANASAEPSVISTHSGGVKLIVNESDAGKAIEILSKAQTESQSELEKMKEE